MTKAAADRFFYPAMILLMTAVVLFGFGRNIDAQLLHPAHSKPVIVAVHAVVCTLWIVLINVQSLLVRVRKIRLHKTLGWSGCVIGALIPPLGLATALVMVRWHLDMEGEADIAGLAVSINDMLTFAIAFALAIRWRRQPERHKRLILVATASLTVAAFARFPDWLMPDFGFYPAVDLLLLAGMARDLVMTRKVHAVYAIALPAMMTAQTIAMTLAMTAPSWWIAALPSFAAETGQHWVGTWSAASQSPFPDSVEEFHDQTVQLTVHTSIGGSQLRIRLSNLYGETPLVIGTAAIANHAVTFNGKPDVTIAAKSEIVSDPLALEVSALSNLAVSLHLPGSSSATTTHILALQSGSVAGESRTLDSWPFLSEVDVLAPAESAAGIAFGDSTVDGDGSTMDSNHRLTDALAVRLQGAKIGVLNQGLIGNRLLRGSPERSREQFGDAFGAAGLARFDRAAKSLAGAKFVILRIGGNDLGLPGPFAAEDEKVSPEDLIAGFRQLAAKARAAKLTVIGTTLPPFKNAKIGEGYFTPEKEKIRLAVNEWIRQTDSFDAVVDFDALLRDPADPAVLRPDYDSGDHLHPNDAGYAALAGAVPLDLLTPHPPTL